MDDYRLVYYKTDPRFACLACEVLDYQAVLIYILIKVHHVLIIIK
jgi:hypothetical protein